MKVTEYDPARDVPDLSGKVILVTGGTAGLGQSTIKLLAAHNPSHIYFTGRNANSAKGTVETCKAAAPNTPITFIPCDLASLANVRNAARKFIQEQQKLDILICNAGIMALPPALTADGYELQFGTNHLGHALLIKHLLPLLQQSSDPRMIALSSKGHMMHPKTGIPFDQLKSTQDGIAAAKWYRYGQSKLANILYAKELARRYPQIMAVPIHPGVITGNTLVSGLGFLDRALITVTNIGRTISVEQGAMNTVWAATVARKEVKAGQYYEPVGVETAASGKGNDMELAAKLWEWTDRELEPFM